TWWDGIRWSGWESRGGVLRSAPAVASWAPDRLDVVAVGADHALWHIYFLNGGWSQFESRGGACLSDPAAVSWGGNRLDVFVIGVDNGLYHSWWDGFGWHEFVRETPGTWTSGAAAAGWAPGRIDLFL